MKRESPYSTCDHQQIIYAYCEDHKIYVCQKCEKALHNKCSSVEFMGFKIQSMIKRTQIFNQECEYLNKNMTLTILDTEKRVKTQMKHIVKNVEDSMLDLVEKFKAESNKNLTYIMSSLDQLKQKSLQRPNLAPIYNNMLELYNDKKYYNILELYNSEEILNTRKRMEEIFDIAEGYDNKHIEVNKPSKLINEMIQSLRSDINVFINEHIQYYSNQWLIEKPNNMMEIKEVNEEQEVGDASSPASKLSISQFNISEEKEKAVPIPQSTRNKKSSFISLFTSEISPPKASGFNSLFADSRSSSNSSIPKQQ